MIPIVIKGFMDPEVQKMFVKRNCSVDTIFLFDALRDRIISLPFTIDERIVDGIPAFFHGDKYIKLIPFPNNITIELSNLYVYQEELNDYKIMLGKRLKIRANQAIPKVFGQIVYEALK